MPIDLESLSAKIESLEKMVDSLDAELGRSGAILELPKAIGAIADCQNEMLSMLEILKVEGIEFWMDGRTLLASMRTKDLLPWESMLEIGMVEEVWNALTDSDILFRNAMKVEGDILTSNELPKIGKMKTQIRTRIWDKDCNGFAYGKTSIPFNAVLPLSERELSGHKFPAPANPLKYLNIMFGDDWMRTV